jgi:hypothetical protein
MEIRKQYLNGSLFRLDPKRTAVMLVQGRAFPESKRAIGTYPLPDEECIMKLAEVMSRFLDNFYAYFSHSIGQSADTGGASFYEAIIRPAVGSEKFRRMLLDDPDAVLRQFGMVLPEGLSIKFLENTDDTIHIVIPPYVGE